MKNLLSLIKSDFLFSHRGEYIKEPKIMLWARTIIYAWRRKQLRKKKPNQLRKILHNTRTTWNPFDPSICQLADWSLSAYGTYGNLSKQPKSVFVRSDIEFPFFLDKILPLINSQTRFILISGDTDQTLPIQTDTRWPTNSENGLYQKLIDLTTDARVVHWFTENLDSPELNISPLPLGCHEKRERMVFREKIRDTKPIAVRDKILKAVCAHRIRDGAQWEKRKAVTELCKNHWQDHVDYFSYIPNSEFRTTLSRYPFVICVGGGGLDPSPKAWVAILSGAIPIIERNPTTEAYSDLPVAFVDEWNESSITQQKLSEWLEELAPYFENPAKRRAVLEKLSLGYWHDLMLKRLYQRTTIAATRED